LGRITPKGVIREFLVAGRDASTSDQLSLDGLALGPDGNLWFWYTRLNGNSIVRINL
jgi:hypothetical protein